MATVMAKPKALKWSKRLPRRKGYYWHRYCGFETIEFVDRDEDGRFHVFDRDGWILDSVAGFGGQWAGPVEPPQ